MIRTPAENLMNVPRDPVLGGQPHMLAYITPEEATSLREQGGGVTPTGGQYRGPGGIASFQPGHGYGKGMSFSGISPAPPGSGGGPSRSGPANMWSAAMMDVANVDLDAASRQKISDNPTNYWTGTDIFGDTMAGKIANVKNSNQPLRNVTIHGLLDSPFGHITALTPSQSLNTPAHERTNIGDPQGIGATLANIFASFAIPGFAGTAFNAVRGLSDVATTGELSVPFVGPILSRLGIDIPAVDISFGESSASETETAPNFFDRAYSSIVNPAMDAAQEAWSSVAPLSEPSQFSVQPRNMGPGPIPLQVPPPAVQPLAVPPLGPLSDVEVADYTDGGHTIEELMEMGVGAIPPLPPVTGVFVNRGGFIDKPLYSRS
jgi:hypothetical protein